MPDVVKPKQYPMPRRAQRARQTRRGIMDAAEELFSSGGYTATTIAEIAERADVAVQTVYAVFGNKRAILTEIIRTRVVGDDEAVPLAEREEWKAFQRQQDPRRLIRGYARASRIAADRVAPVWSLFLDAARSDPEVGQMVKLSDEQRYQDQRLVAECLAKLGAMRPGLSVDRAADSVWAISNPDVYLDLIRRRGWTPDDYETWIGDILEASLLPR